MHREERTMTTIYLIRHAEAEGNVFRRIHGQYDSCVTPNGRRQIAALAQRFAGIPVDAVCIMLVVYGRMIEIYLVTSLGPIPLATMTNGEWHNVGQNYLKSLLALGFQAFLIMVVVGIYSVLIQSISATGDVSGAIWLAMGYTVLLCFCLFKTGSMAKAVFSAH